MKERIMKINIDKKRNRRYMKSETFAEIALLLRKHTYQSLTYRFVNIK